jgi:NTE family protein
MTGIILSGGGARGFAHVGVLKALSEMGIKPAMVSGASAGAVIGAYYAAGFAFDEIIEIVSQTELFRLLDFNFLKSGSLFKTDAVKESFEKDLIGLTFEDLDIPLTVAATDFQNGISHYISEGNLVLALLASSAIPVLYQPVEINNVMFIDGGLLNNFPIEPLKEKCNVIIGVHVNPLSTEDVNKLTIATVLDRCFHLAVSNSVRFKQQQCTFFIEPPELYRYGMFDMDDAKDIAAVGYAYAIGLRKKIEEAMSIYG